MCVCVNVCGSLPICQNYNFTVNFYESETQSLILMKKDRFGMSEKTVVGGIFGLKRK
jgi:hypothetical protein